MTIELNTKEKQQTFRAILLKNGLQLYVKTSGQIIPGRGWTLGNMLKQVSEITGKSYKRSQTAAAQAIEDLKLQFPHIFKEPDHEV